MILPDPFPAAGPLYGWRLDREDHALTWNSGIGAHAAGGRWNSIGRHTIYASVDAATAILEVAVHKGFSTLNRIPHTLTQFLIADPANITIVRPANIPNPHWLNPVPHNPDQQDHGDALLATGKFIAIPSAVSQHSWNILFDPNLTKGKYSLIGQTRFALDPRLSK